MGGGGASIPSGGTAYETLTFPQISQPYNLCAFCPK